MCPAQEGRGSYVTIRMSNQTFLQQQAVDFARHRLAINVRRQDDTLVSAAVFWRLRFDGWAVHVRPVLLYEFSYCSRSLAGLRRRVLDASLHFQS